MLMVTGPVHARQSLRRRGSRPGERSPLAPETKCVRALCFLDVRPAWALSCGCKSRRKEVILIEANRNCERVTDRGKEAGSETVG
jgi:hypothetical protein